MCYRTQLDKTNVIHTDLAVDSDGVGGGRATINRKKQVNTHFNSVLRGKAVTENNKQ